MRETPSLLTGPVKTVLREQSVPMAVGIVFMIIVNVVDTYWAAQLGTAELAAMSFAFPVIGVILNVGVGLMIGTSVAVSRVLGQGDTRAARTLSTHAVWLGLALVTGVSGLGLMTQGPLFRALGAPEALMPYILSYMTLWYAAAVAFVVPMMANGVLRAHGDAKTPRNLMILAAVINAVLDPLFIFGAGPIPAMGLEGAAIATGVSRAIGGVYAFGVLIRRRSVAFELPRLTPMWASWKRILSVGIPATITNVLAPVATAMLTAIVATFGPNAVAAYGIGARVEALILIGPIALSSGLSPFIGQNWGAHLLGRVREGFRVAAQFSALWGVGAWLLLLPLAPWIALAFTDDPDVTRGVVQYLRIVPLGYAPYGVLLMVTSAFNALDQATRSTVLSILRSIVFAVPLAWVFSQFTGITGVFAGLALGSALAGWAGMYWIRSMLRSPDWQPMEEGASLCDKDAVHAVVEAAPTAYREPLIKLVRTMAGLDHVALRKHQGEAIGFFADERQLGHLHATGYVDLPLPVELGDVLLAEGHVTPHRMHDGCGWYTYRVQAPVDVAHAEWLLRVAHCLFEMVREGEEGPHVHAELPGLHLTPASEAAMRQAARRVLNQAASRAP